MKKVLLSILIMFSALLVGCGQKASTDQDVKDAIIKINGEAVTKKQYDELFNAQLSSSIFGANKFDANDPKNRLIALIFKDRVVNELIIKTLLGQEIEKRNIKVNNKEVTQHINKLSEEIGGEKKLKEVLKKNGVKYEQFKETVKNDLKMKKLISSLAITKVSEKDVQKFYDQNKEEKFTSPDMIRAQHILISASEDDIKDRIESEEPNLSQSEIAKKVEEQMAAKKAKAEEILAEAKAKPAEFDKLATKYSEDFSSAKKGGDLGFFREGEMVKPFSDTAFSMKPDTISDVVKTQFGYHIIKVTDRKKAGVTPYKEVKADIKKFLEDQNKVKVLQKFADGIKNTATIEYIDESYKPSVIQDEIIKLSKEQKGTEPKTESLKEEAKK